jgi:hypothetical protein
VRTRSYCPVAPCSRTASSSLLSPGRVPTTHADARKARGGCFGRRSPSGSLWPHLAPLDGARSLRTVLLRDEHAPPKTAAKPPKPQVGTNHRQPSVDGPART